MPPSHGQRWPSSRAFLGAVSAAVLLGGAALVVLWVKERRPAEDLRVSFHIPIANPSNPAIGYRLQNRGRRPAVVRGVGLLEIAGNPAIINDSDNIDLCDKVDAKTLRPPSQITPQGVEINAADQKREEYAPISISVAGKSWTSDSPIEIAGGQSVSVSATFKTDPQQAQGQGNQVFCPVVWLDREAPGSGVAVCQGFAMAMNNGGVSNTIVARQFQIHSASPVASCPVVPQ